MDTNTHTVAIKVASSHENTYSYWLYKFHVYQRNELTGWSGWLCSGEAWERTYSKASWMTPSISLV